MLAKHVFLLPDYSPNEEKRRGSKRNLLLLTPYIRHKPAAAHEYHRHHPGKKQHIYHWLRGKEKKMECRGIRFLILVVLAACLSPTLVECAIRRYNFNVSTSLINLLHAHIMISKKNQVPIMMHAWHPSKDELFCYGADFSYYKF